jgi:hypothetical protein
VRLPALKIEAFPSIGMDDPGIPSESKIILDFSERPERVIEKSAEIGYPSFGRSFRDV